MRTVICITGGIGSGKSIVSRVLRESGYDVYDCDSRAKQIMNCSSQIRTFIEGLFGESIYVNDSLNRELLSSILFNDSEKRGALNRCVHEAVRRDFLSFSKTFSSDIVFIETAIPVTSHIEPLCDYVWLVTAPEDIRIQRVMNRSNIPLADVKARIKVQENEYSTLTDSKIRVLINDNSTPLLTQINQMLQ